MRKVLFLIIIVSVNFSFSQVFSEDWVSPISDWTQVDVDQDASEWESVDLTSTLLSSFGESVTSSSVSSIGTQLTPNNFYFRNIPIDLRALSGKTFLLFDMAIADNPLGTESETISFYYSTTMPPSTPSELGTSFANGDFTLLGTKTLSTGNTIFEQNIDLTSVQGQSIYLLMRHHDATTMSAVFVDNLFIVNSDFTASTSLACVGSPITFVNTSQFNTADVTVEWNFGGGIGNTTANQETVVFSAPGSYTVQQLINGVVMQTKVITIVTTPVPTYSYDYDNSCSPASVVFTTNGDPGYQFSFSDGVVIPVATGNTITRVLPYAGTYDVYVTQAIDANCFGYDSTSGIGFITVKQSPTASFEPTSQKLDMLYPIVSFVNTSSGAISYVWDFGDTSINETVFSPTHLYALNTEGNYDVKLHVTSAEGCVDSIEMTIAVQETVLFFVPTAFTPNGDEYNNTFKPVMISGFDPTTYQFKIFNRWGEMVFESNDPEIGWDGDYGAGKGITATQNFTYKLQFNSSKNDEVRTIVGNVVLMR